MKELTTEEKRYIFELSGSYKELHFQIGEIEKNMEEFSRKTKDLIEKLENKRNEEREFLKELENKYGDGYIDAISLTWRQKKDKKNVTTDSTE
jgi:membrane protein involved in colicin uptake